MSEKIYNYKGGYGISKSTFDLADLQLINSTIPAIYAYDADDSAKYAGGTFACNILIQPVLLNKNTLLTGIDFEIDLGALGDDNISLTAIIWSLDQNTLEPITPVAVSVPPIIIHDANHANKHLIHLDFFYPIALDGFYGFEIDGNAVNNPADHKFNIYSSTAPQYNKAFAKYNAIVGGNWVWVTTAQNLYFTLYYSYPKIRCSLCFESPIIDLSIGITGNISNPENSNYFLNITTYNVSISRYYIIDNFLTSFPKASLIANQVILPNQLLNPLTCIGGLALNGNLADRIFIDFDYFIDPLNSGIPNNSNISITALQIKLIHLGGRAFIDKAGAYF